ncbi:MAG: hypothetical protein K8R75_06125 [Deltaproteobacteria bacterium]|nr:hypothetical protein [Deltaproteobacteria bacterium]
MLKKNGNRSRGYNASFTATHRTVSVYRVLQMRGGGYADVLPVLQVPDNKADVVPCERLLKVEARCLYG